MEDKELKHEFELERVILFSDAVFAIIITIMVLEVKLPEDLRRKDPAEVHKAFVELIPKLVTYMLSFFLVSAFWLRHLKIFKTLRDYDIPLVVRNLIFLFTISLFPFAVSIVLNTVSPRNYWSFDVYMGILLAGNFGQALIVQHIVKHKQKLCMAPDTVEATLRWKAVKANFTLTPIALGILVVLAIINHAEYAPWVLGLQAIILKRLGRRYYPKQKNISATKKQQHQAEELST